MSRMPSGRRAFARYAHGPNALGYCGPPVRTNTPGLVDVAIGADGSAGVDVPRLARQFSGAWPYQQLIGDLGGIPDPLDERVVRAYWTGNDLTRALDREAFGRALIDRLAPQAGHYWSHLTADLLPEAAPTHLFHVLAVYPWSRLLRTGLPEPLQVLDDCRITPAEVLAVAGDALRVRRRPLTYAAGSGLALAAAEEAEVGWLVDGRPFAEGVEPGAFVALHWGFACDVLTPEQARELAHWTDWQLEASNPRIAAGR